MSIKHENRRTVEHVKNKCCYKHVLYLLRHRWIAGRRRYNCRHRVKICLFAERDIFSFAVLYQTAKELVIRFCRFERSEILRRIPKTKFQIPKSFSPIPKPNSGVRLSGSAGRLCWARAPMFCHSDLTSGATSRREVGWVSWPCGNWRARQWTQ